MALKTPTPTEHDEALLASYEYILGLDEVGRGCVAGPIYAAGVVIKKETIGLLKNRVCDSKILAEKLRDSAHQHITENLPYFLAFKDAHQIDSEGIQDCNKTIFLNLVQQALDSGIKSDKLLVLIDGNLDFDIPPGFPEIRSLIKGESKSVAIAAASITAKVFRDRLMTKLHTAHPVYGFDEHKGYGTPKHLAAIRTHGMSIEHRKTFLTRI
jgi:ribonuclease HII